MKCVNVKEKKYKIVYIQKAMIKKEYSKVCKGCELRYYTTSRNKQYCRICAKNRIKKYKREYNRGYYTDGVYYSGFNNIAKRRITSYRQQDRIHGRGNPDDYITVGWIKERLTKQGFECIYCKKRLKMEMIDNRDKAAFSIDRKDNDKAHTKDNCVCACLECNIRRGRGDYLRYRTRYDVLYLAKQLNKIKYTDIVYEEDKQQADIQEIR